MFYFRFSERIIFITPALAVGVDKYGVYFMELAWLNFAIGIGELEK